MTTEAKHMSSADTALEPWWIKGQRERLEQMRNAIKKQPETAMVRYCGDMSPVMVSEVRRRMVEVEEGIAADSAAFKAAGGDYEKM